MPFFPSLVSVSLTADTTWPFTSMLQQPAVVVVFAREFTLRVDKISSSAGGLP